MKLNYDKLDAITSGDGEKRLSDAQQDGTSALQRKVDEAKSERDRAAEVYRIYQENTLKSGELQTEILNGVKSGEDIKPLFLKAVKAISLMTNNDVFYKLIADGIQSADGTSDI